jgi:Flp pilus assembly pilin Flp
MMELALVPGLICLVMVGLVVLDTKLTKLLKTVDEMKRFIEKPDDPTSN